MREDYAHYNVGFDGPKGWRRCIVPVRRLLRRLQRPMLFRQAELMRQLGAEIEQLRDANAAMSDELVELRGRLDRVEPMAREFKGLGCDFLAAKRRLASMEDRLIEGARHEPSRRSIHGPHVASSMSPASEHGASKIR